MANPEYEAKVNPADLYNDEILEQFESIRSVIHKEILPSTYNELIVTSNQAGVFNNEYKFNYYPSTELIFPLSPQSGNINWLEKNFLRFKLIITDNNIPGHHLTDYPFTCPLTSSDSSNFDVYGYTELGIIDGASIFKSIELNYGGTAIWTSAYQQVESFFTFANIPDQLTQASPQYYTANKNFESAISVTNVNSNKIKWDTSKFTGMDSAGFNYDSSIDYTQPANASKQSLSILIDIDISRISPILAWLSLIPGFINKLTLRVVLDAPCNYLVLKYSSFPYIHRGCNDETKVLTQINNNSFVSMNKYISGYRPLPKSGMTYYTSENTKMSYDYITWKMELCEIHQCNATMTEDTRIRLISLIQQMGGKWIYPCRYWNTTIAPIQTFAKGSSVTGQFQFILTGCYFRSISFTTIFEDQYNSNVQYTPGNGLFNFPEFSTMKVYCDSELIASYNSSNEIITDTDSALIDNDKYTISTDCIKSLKNYGGVFDLMRDIYNKALGPPNGLYSGKYTSEKMGTHNIVIQLTFSVQTSTTISAWLGALIDGVIVFDGFNGNYFVTGRKMQQVYEALS